MIKYKFLSFNNVFILCLKGSRLESAVADGGVLGLFLYKNKVNIQGDKIIA